jgi:hypothetical protein
MFVIVKANHIHSCLVAVKTFCAFLLLDLLLQVAAGVHGLVRMKPLSRVRKLVNLIFRT